MVVLQAHDVAQRAARRGRVAAALNRPVLEVPKDEEVLLGALLAHLGAVVQGLLAGILCEDALGDALAEVKARSVALGLRRDEAHPTAPSDGELSDDLDGPFATSRVPSLSIPRVAAAPSAEAAAAAAEAGRSDARPPADLRAIRAALDEERTLRLVRAASAARSHICDDGARARSAVVTLSTTAAPRTIA